MLNECIDDGDNDNNVGNEDGVQVKGGGVMRSED